MLKAPRPANPKSPSSPVPSPLISQDSSLKTEGCEAEDHEDDASHDQIRDRITRRYMYFPTRRRRPTSPTQPNTPHGDHAPNPSRQPHPAAHNIFVAGAVPLVVQAPN